MARPIPSDRLPFRVAIICTLPGEFSAMAAALDIDFRRSGVKDFGKAENDANTYKTGRIHNHDVVIVQLPSTGKEPAASASASIKMSYPNITLALVVGVCAGAPKDLNHHGDIILGDVLISTHVFQPDHARQYDNGRMAAYEEVQDTLGRANKEIRSFLKQYSSDYERPYLQHLVSESVKTLLQNESLQEYAYPGAERDMLFRSEYQHRHPEESKCEQCNKDPASCRKARETFCTELGCNEAKLIRRGRLKPPADKLPGPGSCQKPSPSLLPNFSTPPPSPASPPPPPLFLHFGRFASTDQVIRSSSRRDELIQLYHVIGFEMEAAGVWDNIPTVVIKGVCDYADSHKNKGFQGYAAVTAASCVKVFLELWPLVDPPSTPIVTPIEDSIIESLEGLARQLQTQDKKLAALVRLMAFFRPRWPGPLILLARPWVLPQFNFSYLQNQAYSNRLVKNSTPSKPRRCAHRSRLMRRQY